jgi:hypothetical protein
VIVIEDEGLTNDMRASAGGLWGATRIQVGNEVYRSGVGEDDLHCNDLEYI